MGIKVGQLRKLASSIAFVNTAHVNDVILDHRSSGYIIHENNLHMHVMIFRDEGCPE